MIRTTGSIGLEGAKRQAGRKRVAVLLLIASLLIRFWLVPNLLTIPASLDLQRTVAGEVHLSLLGIFSRDIPIDIALHAKAVAQPGKQIKVAESLRFNSAASDSLILREGLELLLKYATIQTEYAQALRYFFGTEALTSTFWVDARDGTYIAPEEAHGKRWMIPPSSGWPETYDTWQVGLGRGTTLKREASERQGMLRLEHYSGDLGLYNIGTVQVPALGERVRLDSRGEVHLRYERQSHVLTDFNGELRLAAQIGGEQVNFLTIRLNLEKEAANKLRFKAGLYSMLIRLGRDIVPAGAVLTALYLFFGKKKRRK